MKLKIFFSVFYCLSFYYSFSFSDSTAAWGDFKNLVGCWSGSLTYLDYSTNKPFSMPASMIVKDFKKSKNIICSLIYPIEPGANSLDTIFISEDGRFLNNAAIKTISRYNKDSIQIITEINSIDGNDNRAATIRHTYLVGRNTYLTRKEVQFPGETLWLLRNEYKLILVKPCN